MFEECWWCGELFDPKTGYINDEGRQFCSAEHYHEFVEATYVVRDFDLPDTLE